MKELGFCLRHPGKIGAIGRKYSVDVDRLELVREARVIPMVAVFLSDGILLVSDEFPRAGAL
jgi:hypothetical protein